MDARSVREWVKGEIMKRGFDGACGIAGFSEVYSDLMPLQRREVEKICGDDVDVLLREGSVVSIAIFHTKDAIGSICNFRHGKIDYERWNVYADEYNAINEALSGVCGKLASVLDGFAFKAMLELELFGWIFDNMAVELPFGISLSRRFYSISLSLYSPFIIIEKLVWII